MSTPAMRQSLEPGFYEAETYPEVTEQLCREIVERIHSVGKPLKVILFGSRARGDYRPNSDIDILIIERQHPVPKETTRQYEHELKGVYPEQTVVADSLHNVQLWSRVPSHLLTEALRQGRVLFEDATDFHYELERIESSFVAEGTPYKSSVDLAQEWLTLGDRDLKDCQSLQKNDGSPEGACLFLQQAIEKFLKGLRALCEQPDLKTHDLTVLLQECRKHLDLPEMDYVTPEKLEKISKWIFETRYSAGFCATQEDIDFAQRIAATLRRTLVKLLESSSA